MRYWQVAGGVLVLCVAFVAGMWVAGRRGIPFVQRVVEPQWSIGLAQAKSPVEPFRLVVPHPLMTKEMIRDRKVTGLGDPFMVFHDGLWFLFFEMISAETGQGDIGVATSADAMHWQYRGVVLDEPYHLSYPFVFEHEGNFYMIPESSARQAVVLYRATQFPDRWEPVAELLTGHPYVDSSLVYFQGKWWLFTTTPENSYLLLYLADRLEGPWQSHPKNPIVIADPTSTRPGGRPVVAGGKVVRYAQVDTPNYGVGVRAFVVEELSAETYSERPVPQLVLSPGAEAWRSAGMHTIDPHERGPGQWIACVDGWRPARRLVFGWQW